MSEKEAQAEAKPIKTMRVTANRRIIVLGNLKEKGASFEVNLDEKWVHVALKNGYIVENKTPTLKGKGKGKK